MVGVECIGRALGSAGVFLGGVGGEDVVVADNSVAGCLMVVGSFAIGDIVLAVVMGVGEAVGYVLASHRGDVEVVGEWGCNSFGGGGGRVWRCGTCDDVVIT